MFMENEKVKYDAIVIGAGISGILSLLALSKEGKNVLVIEKNNFLGGNCRTYEVDGYFMDTGPHAITDLISGPLKTLINKYFTVVPRFMPFGSYYVRDKDKFQEFPLTLLQLAQFDILSKKDRVLLAGALIDAVANSSLNKSLLEQSVNDFIKKYRLSSKSIKFLDALSYFLSGKSISETPAWRVLGGSGYIEKGDESAKSHIKKFIKIARHSYANQGYPLGGIQSITSCALNSIPKNKVAFKMNEEVVDFIIEDKQIKGIKTNKNIYYSKLVIYSGYAKDLTDLANCLDNDYIKNLAKIQQSKSLTLWLGLKRKMKDLSYIGSEIYFDSDTPYWAIPVSNFDPSLAPKNKQLVGFTTVIKEDIFENQLNNLKNSIFSALPQIKDNIEFEHIQTAIPEKGAVTAGVNFPSPKTPISGLYLVGTDADMRSMGITRASFSVIEALKFMEGDGAI